MHMTKTSICRVFLMLGISYCFVNCNSTLKNEIGTKYYISLNGDDANQGSKAKPWKSISRVNEEVFNPGDQILFEGGQVFEGTIAMDNEDSSTTQRRIIIGSYGEGKATINGGDSLGFYANQCSNLILQNLKFSGSGRLDGNQTDGVFFVKSDSLTISNVEAYGFQHSGIHLRKCSNVLITSCLSSGNGFAGFLVSGSANRDHNSFENNHLTIEHCIAKNNAGDPTVKDNHSGNGILVGGARHVLIDRCVATNNGWDMPRKGNGPVGIWAYQSDQVTIQRCIAYKNRTSPGAKDGGGFDFDGGMTNSVIQYCLSYENEGAGYGLFQYPGADDWYNNEIRYNISINDGKTTNGAGGVFIWNGGSTARELRDCYVYHNVIYNEFKPAVVFEPASQHENFNFSNNIFIGKERVVEGPSSGDRFLGNVWWHVNGGEITFRGYHSLEAWGRATGQEMRGGKLIGMQVDPRLTGPLLTDMTDPDSLRFLIGFQLDSESPLINRGMDLGELLNIDPPEKDFFGNLVMVGNAPEPGISEWKEK